MAKVENTPDASVLVGIDISKHRHEVLIAVPGNGACHLCGDGSVGLTAQIRVVTILRDVTLELVAEAVGLLQDRRLPCQP